MKIRDVMTPDPVTVEPETLLLDAQDAMHTYKVRRLPVVEKDKLVGIITQHMILRASPSPATTLSIYELHYLLAKMRVKDIMVKNPVTLSPDMPFEQALLIGREKGIGGFPVVENGKLVGIATEGDLVKLLTRVLGLQEEGVRITIDGLGARLGELGEIIAEFDRHKTPILSMMSLPSPKGADWIVVVRVKTDDAERITLDLKEKGFHVTDMG